MKTTKDYMFMCVTTHHESVQRLLYGQFFGTIMTATLMCGIAYDMIERGLY